MISEIGALIITIIYNLSPNTDNATKSRTKLVEKVAHICTVTWVPVKVAPNAIFRMLF